MGALGAVVGLERALGLPVRTRPRRERLVCRAASRGLLLRSLAGGEPRILLGASALGSIPAIPTYVVLDSAGRVVARYTGFASENKLERLLDAARGR